LSFLISGTWIVPTLTNSPATFYSDDKTFASDPRELLESFGWKDIIDLGDISNARDRELPAALARFVE
jgi:hypothetical protein